jgi:hypothetical protein
VFPIKYELNFVVVFERNVVFKGLKGVEEATPTTLVYSFMSSSVSRRESWAFSGLLPWAFKYSVDHSAEDGRLKVWCAYGSTSKSGLTPTLEGTRFLCTFWDT